MVSAMELPGFRDFYPYPVPPGEAWSYESRRRIETWAQTARSFRFLNMTVPLTSHSNSTP